MKIALFGSSDLLKAGKHNLKDPRLDQANELVPADKKTQAQVDVVLEDKIAEADAILTTDEKRPDLILKDLEFVETRLQRDPEAAERKTLEKIKALLESEQFILRSNLTPEELETVAAHSFYTNKPITTGTAEQ